MFLIGVATLFIIVGITVGTCLIDDYEITKGVIAIGISVVLAAGAVIGSVVLSLHTEPVQFTLTTKNNSIERTITVYDSDNNQIMKFDDATNIEPHENRLVFYDENENLQLVYYDWGTVIINEEY